jgi:peptidoglycan/xylan/chitin deacetylase (PgdA/CDA1 family)
VHNERHERWRRLLKSVTAAAICRARMRPLSAVLGLRRPQPLIIGYHRVVGDFAVAAETDMPTMLVSRVMFEHHLECLGRHFRFVSLDEIGDHVERGEPFSQPVAAITFDDGYRDVYENAFPILRRKGIPAAIFVVTDLVGHDCWQVHDRLYTVLAKAYPTWSDPRLELSGLLADLDAPIAETLPTRADTRNPFAAASSLLPVLPQADIGRLIARLEAHVGHEIGEAPLPLTWQMIAEMRAAGFTIGSHTRTHAWLAMESPAKSADEIAGSKHELERRLGEPVTHFAYPGGQFTPSTVETVARTGYRFAYTACCHHDPTHPSLTLERLLLWEGSSIGADGRFSSDILSCQAHGLWPPARRCERVHAYD